MPNHRLGAYRLILDFPTVVIGYEIDRGKRNLGFSRQLGFREICHADDIKTHFTMKFRFRPSREGGPIHVHIGSAVVNGIAEIRRLLGNDRSKVRADRIRKADMGNDSIPKKGPIRPTAGSIEEL